VEEVVVQALVVEVLEVDTSALEVAVPVPDLVVCTSVSEVDLVVCTSVSEVSAV
jgi:hypothetical protein